METQVIDEQVLVHAPIAVVWRALTDPDITEKYWGGTRIESTWKKGSPVLYRRGGVIVDEHVLFEVVPHRLIEHSFHPTFGEFKNEAPSLLTVLLALDGEATRVSVLHRGFPPNSKVYAACRGAWPEILKSLKVLLEA